MQQKTIEQVLVRLRYFLERENWDQACSPTSPSPS